MAGMWMNTGEGGLSPYHLEGEADIVYQIGTAKYGVRDAEGNLDDTKLRAIAEHTQVKMFELKLAQGAKPGKGGILPAAKITDEIAAIRGLQKGQDGISPNRHREASTNGELLDLVGHIREVTGKPVGIKTVMGHLGYFEELFEEINARGPDSAPDFITLDGGEGGTGAAPMPLMDLVGMSIREALPRLTDLRNKMGLKDRIRLIASGKLVNPGDVAWALAAGADFVVSGLHVLAWLYSGAEVPQEYLSDRHHHARSPVSGRAGRGRKGQARGPLRQVHRQGCRDHCPFRWRVRAAPTAPPSCADRAARWQFDPDGPPVSRDLRPRRRSGVLRIGPGRSELGCNNPRWT
jgi:hypothetical protein